MTLPDFVLLSRVNVEDKFSGIDSTEFCQQLEWFEQYPYEVSYKYNSRGFRDEEWPDDLTGVIWCFGDSFTVGLGSPLNHMWTNMLQRKMHTRCINVSLDGGSNQWIARKIESLSQSLLPSCVIVHWSYIHRRESSGSILTKILDRHWTEFYNKIKDPTWPDCLTVNDFDQLPEFIKQEIVKIHAGPAEHALLTHCPVPGLSDDEGRRLFFDPTSNEPADIDSTINCIDRVNSLGINVIHSFIPEFASESAVEKIVKHLDQQQCRYVLPFRKLDRARDGHHYDVITSNFFTDQLVRLI
jgi:hypothetical protein